MSGEDALHPSTNDYDWLGHGIYFWEDDPVRAAQWARHMHGQDGAVVGALINLGNCLDMAQTESRKLVRHGYDLMVSLHDAGVLEELPRNAPGRPGDPDELKRNLDCLVINTVHLMREKLGESPFDSVRSPFLEGSPLYEGAGFRELTHIQVCVRDESQIVGYFLPRGVPSG